MQDAWRAYLELALGLTEAPKRKAQQAVKKLVGQSGTTAAQLQSLAEELVSTSAANRESLTKLVRFEVDRALGLVGLATAEEVTDLESRVRELERELRQVRSEKAATSTPNAAPDAGGSVGDAALAAALEEPAPDSGRSAATKAPTQAGAVKKAVAKKAVAKKAVVKQTTSGKTVAKKTVAKKTVAKKSPADEEGS